MILGRSRSTQRHTTAGERLRRAVQRDLSNRSAGCQQLSDPATCSIRNSALAADLQRTANSSISGKLPPREFNPMAASTVSTLLRYRLRGQRPSSIVIATAFFCACERPQSEIAGCPAQAFVSLPEIRRASKHRSQPASQLLRSSIRSIKALPPYAARARCQRLPRDAGYAASRAIACRASVVF